MRNMLESPKKGAEICIERNRVSGIFKVEIFRL